MSLSKIYSSLKCLLVTSLVLAGLFSCTINNCIDPLLRIEFSGFDSADLSQVRIVAVDRVSKSTVQDSIWNLAPRAGGGGSVGFPLDYKQYEYTATLLSLNKEFRFTDFEIKRIKKKQLINGGEVNTCSNNIIFKMNGEKWATDDDVSGCSESGLTCWAYIKVRK